MISKRRNFKRKSGIMGKIDTLTRDYMQDAEVFADAFNYLIYDGDSVISPDQLHELDTAGIVNFFGENNENAQAQVYRDVLKSVTAMEDGEFAYLILGVENQAGIHYAMPVRCMVYDGLQYYSQIKTASKINRNNKGIMLSKDEYVSGFANSDRILPVITLVVYFGNKPWDGPKSLHEMMDLDDPVLLDFVADYRINLIEATTMNDEDIAKFKTDLKDVFYFIKYSGDKERLRELVETNEDFRHMKRSTAEMIKAVTNSDIKLPEREECVDMCLAIEQMREESIAIGEARGVAIGEAKGGLKKLFELVKEELLTVGQAASNAKLSEDEFVSEMRKAGF